MRATDGARHDLAALGRRARQADGHASPTPVGGAFRLEHLRTIGWQLFTEAQIVQWCGHDHHFLVVPDADGERAVLAPILGEAA